MSLYRRLDTGEIRDLDPALVAALHPNKRALWEAYTPPPAPPPAPSARVQATDIILQRLTPQEREALFTARRTVWQIDYLMTRATSTGTIHEDDPDFPDARAMLDQAGIIAASRWEELFA